MDRFLFRVWVVEGFGPVMQFKNTMITVKRNLTQLIFIYLLEYTYLYINIVL